MSGLGRLLLSALLGLVLLSPPLVCRAAQAPAPRQETVSDQARQSQKLAGELRRIQRELAALRADLNKPHLQDVFAGIGYIFGLFGTAAYVASRRRKE